MTALELIAAGEIRESRGDKIVRGDGRSLVFCESLSEMLAAEKAKYAGAIFVGWDEDVPDEVPLGTLTWASKLYSETAGEFGLMVTWSTPEREVRHRAENAPLVREISFDEFNVRRHAHAGDDAE